MPDPGPSPHPDAATRPIHLVHRGLAHSVSGLPSTTSVLAWLREHRHCTGTKEGCNEGDCGACTVLVAELDEAGTGLHIKPVNSCIQFLPTLDGKAVVTVEDLGGQHPAQQAMVACHGSQCGFCTPGFVMSLAACHARHVAAQQAGQQQAGTAPPPPSRQQLADDLSGNLCRCTGYRPILDAGEQMFQRPGGHDWASTIAALQALRAQGLPPLRYADATPFHAPRSLPELAAARLARPQARLLAGSTDIGLWVNKQFKDLGDIIYLGEVAELKAITTTTTTTSTNGAAAEGWLTIGAGASLQAAWDALTEHWPTLREMGLRFASRPVREAGTMGGNLANGSPIGDSAPVLMALDARLLLRRGEQQRTVPLDQFYLGYMRNQLAEGEFVQAVQLPLPPADPVQRGQLRAYKLSKRYDCDISALACGLWIRLAEPTAPGADALVAEARLAFGGLAATVARARQAEAALVGQPWTEATLQAAQAALGQDFQPLSDLRASASYRQRAMRNLLRRFWLETRADAPLQAQDISVWSAA